MRRWDVDPDRHSPDTRPAGSYDLVYEDDRSDVIAHSLTFPEAMLIATAHNAEVALHRAARIEAGDTDE